MKVTLIRVDEIHCGDEIVIGDKTTYTLHKVLEVHIQPRENKGRVRVQSPKLGYAVIPFVLIEADGSTPRFRIVQKGET